MHWTIMSGGLQQLFNEWVRPGRAKWQGREGEMERERGVQGLSGGGGGGVFKLFNDGRVNDFKRIIRVRWEEGQPRLNRHTFTFIW